MPTVETLLCRAKNKYIQPILTFVTKIYFYDLFYFLSFVSRRQPMVGTRASTWFMCLPHKQGVRALSLTLGQGPVLVLYQKASQSAVHGPEYWYRALLLEDNMVPARPYKKKRVLGIMIFVNGSDWVKNTPPPP